MAIFKSKRFPERTKIYWDLWHSATHDYNTERNYGKLVPGMFLAMTPSCHEMHSLTREELWKRQQPIVTRYTIFSFARPFQVLHISYVLMYEFEISQKLHCVPTCQLKKKLKIYKEYIFQHFLYNTGCVRNTFHILLPVIAPT